MTQFFTIMWLTFTVDGHGQMQTGIPYPSQQACGDALPAVYETIRLHYRDSAAQCKPTKVLSASIRPKQRPEGIGQ